MEQLSLRTTHREEMLNITSDIRTAVRQHAWICGALLVFCPHTTCGLTINEGADPDVQRDMLRFFAERIPKQSNWRHIEGNSDAHLKASITGSSVLIPLEKGDLCLGTWQSIYLFEGDGPRTRTVWLQPLAGA